MRCTEVRSSLELVLTDVAGGGTGSFIAGARLRAMMKGNVKEVP